MLTLTEAAQQCGLHPATLRHAVAVGNLKARKYGKMWFVSKHDLVAWQNNPKFHIPGRKGTK